MPVKPQGQYGDRKNDGFDKTMGTYYQVYAPENITIKQKETIEKLVADFAGLYSYWQAIVPINLFYFVVNDKYKGVYPSLYEELSKIEKTYTPIKANPLLAKNLEDIFLSLDETAIEDVLGTIPAQYNGDVEFGVMKDVVDFLLIRYNIKLTDKTEGRNMIEKESETSEYKKESERSGISIFYKNGRKRFWR